jgi:hypothetical protein
MTLDPAIAGRTLSISLSRKSDKSLKSKLTFMALVCGCRLCSESSYRPQPRAPHIKTIAAIRTTAAGEIEASAENR